MYFLPGKLRNEGKEKIIHFFYCSMTILVWIGTKTCLPKRFDSDFDLTHKTTDCRIGTSAGYVCSRWIRVLFRNAFKAASGISLIYNIIISKQSFNFKCNDIFGRSLVNIYDLFHFKHKRNGEIVD